MRNNNLRNISIILTSNFFPPTFPHFLSISKSRDSKFSHAYGVHTAVSNGPGFRYEYGKCFSNWYLILNNIISILFMRIVDKWFNKIRENPVQILMIVQKLVRSYPSRAMLYRLIKRKQKWFYSHIIILYIILMLIRMIE